VVTAVCERSLATATFTASIGSGWLAAAALALSIDALFHAASVPPTAMSAPRSSAGLVQR
jgi:hypothetical protein